MKTNDLAKVIETTREAPENIGTAFKTIIARLAQVKESTEELDDDFNLNKADKALGSIGISLTDTTGQIRDMQEVFGELGLVWDGLDRNTKAYMATVLAGLIVFGSVKIPLIAGTSLEAA